MFRSKLLVVVIGMFSWVGLTSAISKAHATTADAETLSWNLFSPDPGTLSAEINDEKLDALIAHFQKQGIDIRELLKDKRFEIYEDIANRFRKSAERKSQSLDSYKHVLGFDKKSDEIIRFIDTYREPLKVAEETYGISKYVIAAILGIESDFGKNTGSYNPFNAYVSMYAKGYRQDFALEQLNELLEFTKRKNIDVFELKSSYAGAVAFAQFIPYSLNKWFVGDDIFNMKNNIMSVGNYLAYFKERTGDIETAVLRYNPSSLYTNAVLDLAQHAETHFNKSR